MSDSKSISFLKIGSVIVVQLHDVDVSAVPNIDSSSKVGFVAVLILCSQGMEDV